MSSPMEERKEKTERKCQENIISQENESEEIYKRKMKTNKKKSIKNKFLLKINFSKIS